MYTPSGLMRIREEPDEIEDSTRTENDFNSTAHSAKKFSEESVHSYNFSSNTESKVSETKKSVFSRSLEFLRDKANRVASLSGMSPSTGLPPSNSPHPQNSSSATENPENSSRLEKTIVNRLKAASLKGPISPISIRTRNLSDVSNALPSPGMNALHSPTRFIPQNQGVLTTNLDGIILVTNELMSLISGYQCVELVGMNILDLFPSPYKEKQAKVVKNKSECKQEECVLMCGKVVRVQKKNGKTIAASLWLKLRQVDSGEWIYMWVIEEIKESTLSCHITAQGIVSNPNGAWFDVYGYSDAEVNDKPIWAFIPSLQPTEDSPFSLSVINDMKFFGAIDKQNLTFPVIAKVMGPSVDQPQAGVQKLQIISMPNIAGVITIHENGIVQSCNTVFTKYLFGYSSKHLIGKENISTIIPQTLNLISDLRAAASLKRGLYSATLVRQAALNSPSSQLPPEAAQSATIPSPITPPSPSTGILAIHRDGTHLTVDMQIRSLSSSSGMIYALWITYDRNQQKKPLPTPKVDISPLKLQLNEHAEMDPGVTVVGNSKTHATADISTEKVLVRPGSAKSRRKISEYEIDDSLGEGAYGYVKLAHLKDDPKSKKVVIKYVLKSRILIDSWVRDPSYGLIPLEIQILDRVRSPSHPNIVCMKEFFEDEDHYYIVMKLHGSGMDLFDYVELNTNMMETEIKFIFKQICEGVKYLHERGIVHRDIKDENVILDKDSHVQLIDFGSSAYVKPNKLFDTFCGTIDYCAPEILLGRKYAGPPQDVWALGILLYVLIYKECPFYNVDEIVGRDIRGPYILSKDSLDLIRKMLCRDVNRRPTIQDVLDHPWLRKTQTPSSGK